MAVDWLRSCYSSNFYYSSNPPLSLVGKYSFAREDAEMLPSPNPYASSVWLKRWEASEGLGDSLEEFQWSDGEPLSEDVKRRAIEVLPLRTGCESLIGKALPMSGNVTDDLPTLCWKSVPRHGPYSYLVAIPGITFDDGTGPQTISNSFILRYSGNETWYSYAPQEAPQATLYSEEGYPDTPMVSLLVYLANGSSVPMFAEWLLPVQMPRENFILARPPDSVFPYGSVVSNLPITVMFVAAPNDSYANPLDIFP